MSWLDIETAPKDETHFLGYTAEGDYVECYWMDVIEDGVDEMGCDAGFWSRCGTVFPGRSFGNPTYFSPPLNQPMYWMPLAAPPEVES